MYSGNKEYFALKRELLTESNINICDTLKFENDHTKYIFVYEWINNDKNILGYGCDINGNAKCLQIHCKPALFVVTQDYRCLIEICALYGYRTQIFKDITYECNNFAVFDLFYDYDISHKPCYLARIETDTIANTHQLYSKFKYNEMSYKFVSVPQYWDCTKQILFELLVKNHIKCKKANISYDYSKIHDTTMQWFNINLDVNVQLAKPKIPLITFDIETISSDPHRVPKGDHCDDILFTVSIHHTYTNILYTLIYLHYILKKII